MILYKKLNFRRISEFANMDSIGFFTYDDVIEGLKHYSLKKYNVLSDKDDCITIQSTIDDKSSKIYIDDQVVFLEGYSEKDVPDYHFVMLFLYVLYKYKPYTKYQESLIYKNRQYILDDAFPRALVAAYGFVDYLNKNFQFLDYFNFIKYADSLDISDLDIEKQKLFYSFIFKVEIREKNIEYIIDILSNYIHFYRRGLMLYQFVERLFELINYNENTYFEKIFKRLYNEYANANNKEAEAVSYIYLRYQYEIKKDETVKAILLSKYENNSFIQKYFNVNNLVDNNQKDSLFFKKSKYTDDDIPYIISNISSWDYEQKEHVLLNILYENMDFKYFLALKDYINKEELKKICTNKEVNLFFNKKFMDYVFSVTEDIDIYIEYLNYMKLINFSDYWYIVKNDKDGFKLAKLVKFLIYIVNDYSRDFDSIVTRFISMLEYIARLEYGSIFAHILARYSISNASIGIIRDRNNIAKYVMDDFQNDTVKLKYGYNNINDFLKGVNFDDKLLDILKNVIGISTSYECNPNALVCHLYYGKALISELKFLSDVTYSKCNILFDNRFISLLIKLVYDSILSGDDRLVALNEKFKEEEQKQQELIIETKKQESKKTLDGLINIVNKTDIMISNDKIEIIPCIKLIRNNNGYINKQIYFKVSNGKVYIVKDYHEFIMDIINENIGRYGKSLAFNHAIESFDKRSQDLINLFIGQGQISSINQNERFAYLSDNNLDAILSMYDSIIILEEDKTNFRSEVVEEEYIIDKELKDVSMYLNKDYNLKLRIEENDVDGYILFGNNKAYLINDNHIQFLKYNKDMMKIYDYVLSNNVNVKYNKNTFIKDIYGRYVDNIKVDDSIKEEFKLKELKIDAYFDSEGDKITYYNKYYINDEEVSEREIAETSYLYSKLSIFENIIEKLGFVDGKLEGLEKVYMFLSADLSKLNEVANVYLSENIKLIRIKKYTKTSVNMSYNAGLLDVCFEKGEYSDEDLYKIVSSLRKKLNYVKLKDNSIVKLDEKDASELLSMVDELNLDAKHLNEVQEVPLYQSLKLVDQINYSGINISDNIKDLLNEIANYKEAPFVSHETFVNIMRNYQIDAFKWIKTLIKYNFSGILADDMGLGKSLEIISVIEDDDKEMPSLIVCPKSLIFNWESEFNKWYPNIPVYPVYGNARERANAIKNFDDNKKQIFIISYDSLKNDLDIFDKLMFRFAILDEAQFIKNHNTLKAKSVKNINSELRFVLTGTPIENSVIDLWSIFDFLMPSYLYNYSTFSSRFEKSIIEKDDNAYKTLLAKISPFILRRTKKDVLKDLPEKIEVEQVVSMNENQRKVYEAQLLKTRIALDSDESKISVLSMITRLRQLCVDPNMFLDTYDGDSCKLEAINDIIDDNIDRHKILIFSQFVKSFANIEKLLASKNIRYSKITGETKAEERIEIATDFNDTDKYQVLLISLKAGGTGLNLIGSDLVIHLDPWWNVAAMNQASDRAHRIGQKNVVNIIKLVCKDSIEQKIIELQNAKKDLVDKLIADDDNNIRNLSYEDLKYILD